MSWNDEIFTWNDWIEILHGVKNFKSLQGDDSWFNNETLLKMYKDLWDDWGMGQVYRSDWPKKSNVNLTSSRDWKEAIKE